MQFDEKLDLPEIAGLTLQVINQMAKYYLFTEQTDPILYRTLRLAGELADQYKERAEEEKASEKVLDAIGNLANDIHLQAMEVGAICRKIIEENGLDPRILDMNVEISPIDDERLDKDGKQ